MDILCTQLYSDFQRIITALLVIPNRTNRDVNHRPRVKRWASHTQSEALTNGEVSRMFEQLTSFAVSDICIARYCGKVSESRAAVTRRIRSNTRSATRSLSIIRHSVSTGSTRTRRWLVLESEGNCLTVARTKFSMEPMLRKASSISAN
jgi:hypothetical protein